LDDSPAEHGSEPAGTRPVIALIEDEPNLAAASSSFLERQGFRVLRADDGHTGMAIVAREPVDVVVLDLGLPDGNGLDLLRGLRADDGSVIPVIIVTGRDGEADRVAGLELGADDYLVKPFFQRELTARIRALLRRVRQSAAPAVIHIGELLVDVAAREVRAAGQRVAFTPLEYGLVEFLAGAPGRTFSAGQILSTVWRSSSDWQTPATVSEHVYRVRRRLAATGVTSPRITTVRGYGYRLDR
jgi:DNA-binding response OmpR family regulator